MRCYAIEVTAEQGARLYRDRLSPNDAAEDPETAEYEQLMREGKWVVPEVKSTDDWTHTLRFKDGRLAGGRHRMLALARSGTTQKFLVQSRDILPDFIEAKQCAESLHS